jgi:hypothetical protein
MCALRDFEVFSGRWIAIRFRIRRTAAGEVCFVATDGNDAISADTKRSGSEDPVECSAIVATMPGSSEIFPIGLTRLVPGFKKVGSCEHIAPPHCPHCFFGSEGPVTFGYFASNWIQITRPCRELEIFRTGLRLYHLLHTEII